MKKSLALLAVLGCFSQSSMAATTFTLANLNTGTLASIQSNFRLLSEDFGAAMSYKPVTPAAALGLTGFDVGIEVSATDMAKSAAVWKTITGDTAPGYLPIPKLTAAKGLPFGIDISAFISSVLSTDIKLVGGALSYAILEGGVIEPALTVRAAATRLSGITGYSLSTKSVDVSFSKGFIGITPYVGAGYVWVDSSTTNVALVAAGLQAEKFNQSKIYGGLNVNLGLPNFAIEVDQTGGIQTISAKLGLRW